MVCLLITARVVGPQLAERRDADLVSQPAEPFGESSHSTHLPISTADAVNHGRATRPGTSGFLTGQTVAPAPMGKQPRDGAPEKRTYQANRRLPEAVMLARSPLKRGRQDGVFARFLIVVLG